MLSLAVILVGGGWFNRRLEDQLRQTEAAELQLQMTLTREMAGRLDGDLRQLAMVSQLMAATLTQRADWTDRQLDAWMREAIQKDSRLFGVCVSFEPYQFDPGQADFSLYVYRDGGKVTAKQLTFPDYSPQYREWPWYTEPIRQRRAVWTEPFVDDEGGANIPMLTYAVPLERQGKFVGIVSLDLSLDYFQVLQGWLDKLRVGRGGYAFVVSGTGRFICHPDPTCMPPRTLADIRRFQEDDSLRSLMQRMLEKEEGCVTATDPWTDRPALFLYAPVPSAGWSLAIVIGK